MEPCKSQGMGLFWHTRPGWNTLSCETGGVELNFAAAKSLSEISNKKAEGSDLEKEQQPQGSVAAGWISAT